MVEDSLDSPVPYGVLRYADREWRVEYNTKQREKLLSIVHEMRSVENALDLERNAQLGYEYDSYEKAPQPQNLSTEEDAARSGVAVQHHNRQSCMAFCSGSSRKCSKAPK